MCPPAAPDAPRMEDFYSPVTKCCTYQPELANFLVGGVLADESLDALDALEGRASIEQRIERRVEVTPLGLGRSRVYWLLYMNGLEAFGQATSMECPHHLADGRCGVWRHRESTCATWFCKHERGQTGKHFWRRLHALLAAAEGVLSRHCVLEIGLSPAALELLFPPETGGREPGLGKEQLDGQVDAARYRALWGNWFGREREFFRRSAEIVAALSFADILALGGPELELRARLTRAAHEVLVTRDVPERVRPRRLQVLQMSADSVRVSTYSNIDPLSLPNKLFHALHCFDGRPTAEALREIEAAHHLRVAPGVVRKLVDFGLLEEEH